MTDDEAFMQRFHAAKPRGLEQPSAPTVPSYHQTGTTGEGRDKSGGAGGAVGLPIVPGRIGDAGDGTGGTIPGVQIVFASVLYDCTVDGKINSPV